METKDRVFYQIFVNSFSDSNNDGIGDIQGIISRLDYLQDLGVKGIWLTPIFASPSKHGYDTTDYYSIKKEYGTMEDFNGLIKQAHDRDIAIILDMVFNHTSNKHEWFIKSSQYDSKYRDYYIWSKNNSGGQTPMNNKPWKFLNGEYYYSSFWEGMPNLNHNNPKIREEILNISKYWLDKGVDGFRLDAVRWTYNDINKGVEFWKWFADGVKAYKNDIYLVGECWDSMSITSQYTKALGSAFNFDLRFSLIDKLNWKCLSYLGKKVQETYNTYYKNLVNKYNGYDSIFLSNHDMNRIFSDLNFDMFKLKVAVVLLLTLPGTPYIYYGDEICVKGTKEITDENVRLPIDWNRVKQDQEDKNSILNLYKKLIHIRNNNEVLQKGNFTNIETSHANLSFKREYDGKGIHLFIDYNAEEIILLHDGIYEIL